MKEESSSESLDVNEDVSTIQVFGKGFGGCTTCVDVRPSVTLDEFQEHLAKKRGHNYNIVLNQKMVPWGVRME